VLEAKKILEDDLQNIKTIHTLGPSGTNCEKAASKWFADRGMKGETVLHPTLETALKSVIGNQDAALLGCVVYPALHNLVFSNLDKLKLHECFVMETFHMVLAAKEYIDINNSKIVASHKAPSPLILNLTKQVKLVNSNSQAAIVCANGEADACITTYPLVEKYGLKIIENFGKVPMGFTIHINKNN